MENQNNTKLDAQGNSINPLLAAGWVEAQSKKPIAYRPVLLCFEKESAGMREMIKTGIWCGDCFFADGGYPLLTKKVIAWMELPDAPACS